MISEVRKKFEKSIRPFRPYAPWNHLTNWWKNIRWFFRSFGLAIQRARKGYSCTYDIMDLNDYFVGCLACALDDFAEHNNGIPLYYLQKNDNNDERAFKEWNDEVKRFSMLLFQSLESLEEFNYNIPDFPGDVVFKENGEVLIIGDKKEREEWQNHMEDVAEDRLKCRKEAFKWLNEHWEDLWI